MSSFIIIKMIHGLDMQKTRHQFSTLYLWSSCCLSFLFLELPLEQKEVKEQSLLLSFQLQDHCVGLPYFFLLSLEGNSQRLVVLLDTFQDGVCGNSPWEKTCLFETSNPVSASTPPVNKVKCGFRASVYAFISSPLLLFIILDRPLLGAEALASRLFLFSFILSLMSSRLCWKDFFWARSFAMARDLCSKRVHVGKLINSAAWWWREAAAEQKYLKLARSPTQPLTLVQHSPVFAMLHTKKTYQHVFIAKWVDV